MMRLFRFIIVLMLVLFVVSSASAQTDMVTQLGSLIDSRVQAAGYSTSGGQLPTLRDQLAQSLSAEINDVSTQINELDSSPAGQEWLSQIDAVVNGNTPDNAATQFEAYRHSAQVTALSDDDLVPIPPPPAQLSEDDLAPIPPPPAQLSEDDLAPIPPPPAQLSEDDLAPIPPPPAQLSEDDLAPIPPPPAQLSEDDLAPIPPASESGSDIGTRISDAVRDVASSEDGSPLPPYQPSQDPIASALQDAIDAYTGELTQQSNPQHQQAERAIAEALANGVGDMVDQSNLPHKTIVKRVIQRSIQIMLPSEDVPISGYWREEPHSYTQSGTCQVYDGDNGGMGLNESDNPGEPLCGYDAGNGLSFIEWQGQDLHYIPGTSSIYSDGPLVTMNILRDANGATTGSMRSVHSTEYEVVAPDRIIVHDFIREASGCTLQSDYALVLVAADESVCNYVEMPTELTATPVPVTTPPPGEERTVRVGSPIFTDEQQCDDQNRPPSFDSATITTNANGNLVFNYGGASAGSLTLFDGGSGYYEYDSGSSAPVWENVSVSLYDDGTGGSIFWSNDAKNGKQCSASIELTYDNPIAPEAPAAASTPAPNGDAGDFASDTGDSSSSSASGGMTGNYTVAWAGYPGMDCPAALDTSMPSFSTAVISAADGGYQLDADGESYPLVETTPGQYSYMVFNSDNSGTVIVVGAPDGNGHLAGSYTFFAADGSMCVKALDFAPA